MLTPTRFHRIYRLSAWYDLAISWPYATPLTLSLLWTFLSEAHDQLEVTALPALSVYAVLFANFFGSVVVVWSLVRLVYDDPRLARYDAAGRWLFSAWMLNALWAGASPLLWLFLVIEVSFAILQSLPLRRELPV